MMNSRYVLQRSFLRSFNQRSCYSGLLSGIEGVDGIKASHFYASTMDLKDTVNFLKQPSYVYQQAEKDLPHGNQSNIEAYLHFLDSNVSTWMNKDEFYDRELILQTIHRIIQKRGQFVCLLGGKSTGKSLMMNHLSRKENNYKHLSIIPLDMRQFPDGDILAALLTYLLNTRTESCYEIVFKSIFTFISKNIDDIKNEVIVSMANIMKEHADTEIPAAFIEMFKGFKTADLLNLLRANNITDANVISNLLCRLSVAFGNITIVIDEANLAFTEEVGNDINRLKKSKKDLEVLTALSKQSKQINVILCSSEHSFPFRLGKIGFNEGNFTKLIFMGEVPPCSMYELLTKEWKYGEHLAVAMMEHLGGHIWDHANAISELALLKERFHPSFVYDINHTASVLRCLKRFKKDEILYYLKAFPEDRELYREDRKLFLKKMDVDEKRMKEYLTAIAVRGFSAAADDPYEDRVCEMVSHTNVGGVVKKTGVVFGLPDEALKGKIKYGLVPAKQSMRLVITEQLVD